MAFSRSISRLQAEGPRSGWQMAQSTMREKLRVKTNQFQLQAVLLPDVMQVRAELADADDRYQQTLLEFWIAKADYELALGEEVRQ